MQKEQLYIEYNALTAASPALAQLLYGICCVCRAGQKVEGGRAGQGTAWHGNVSKTPTSNCADRPMQGVGDAQPLAGLVDIDVTPQC